MSNKLIEWNTKLAHQASQGQLINHLELFIERYAIGDFIGQFKPGNLVLIGSYLAYKWMTNNESEELVESADKVLLFTDRSLRQTSLIFPELQELIPLLERAKYGIEFEGISLAVEMSVDNIRKMSAQVLKGLVSFCNYCICYLHINIIVFYPVQTTNA